MADNIEDVFGGEDSNDSISSVPAEPDERIQGSDYDQDDDLLPRGLPGSTLEDDGVPDSNGPDLR